MRTGIQAATAFLAFLLLTGSIFADIDPSQEFLSEDLDLEEILTEIPQDVSFFQAKRSDLVGMNIFTADEADRIIAVRDSLARMSIRFSPGSIEGLTVLQRTVLAQYADNSRSTETPSHTSFRSGYHYTSSSDDLMQGKYYLKSSSRIGDTATIDVLSERDAREPDALDFLSGSLTLSSKKYGLTTVIGDYLPGFGQGLVFSRYGRSYAGGTGILRHDSQSSALTFFDEVRFLRGFQCSYNRSRVSAGVFLSERKLDATLDSAGDALTIRTTGYHYSGDPSGNLHERLLGGRTSVKVREGMSLGFLAATSDYSPGITVRTDERGLNDIAGNRFSYFSVDGSVRTGMNTYFFEYARMSGGADAVIGGIAVKYRGFSASLAARRYDRDYSSFRAAPLSSFGGCSNEEGVYGAFEIKPVARFKLSASMDLSRNMSRTYFNPMPDSRRRFSLSADTKLLRKMTASVLIRSTDDDFSNGYRRSVSASLKGIIGKRLLESWRTCLAWSSSGNDNGPFWETGTKTVFDHFVSDVAVNVYDLPTYDSRFYRYVSNVTGKGGSDAYWGRGWSVTGVLRYGCCSARYRYGDSTLKSKINEMSFQVDVSL